MNNKNIQCIPDSSERQEADSAIENKELGAGSGKTSFLILQHNKYRIIRTSDIAYFYTKRATSIIVCFNRTEYFVNYSLDRIQAMVSSGMFFRANRQYLINFSAVKDVEHYFARKLLVNLQIPVADKLIIPKEKGPVFLHWLEHR